jgi:hypothetical protein
MKIHFIHDPAMSNKPGMRISSSSALGSSSTTCCLVYKNEMYSVMSGTEWSSAAPRFGIPFGSTELCVHIEIADADARPTQYRERLISPDTGEDIVPLDFAVFVRERMPEWVKGVIRNASPRHAENFNDVEKELQQLLNRLKVMDTGRRIDDQGKLSLEQGDRGPGASGNGGRGGGGGIGARNTRHRFHAAPEGATLTSLYDVFERAPKIAMLTTPEEVREKGLNGRAAEFIVETGDLFVNGLYEAVERTVTDVEPEFVGQTEAEKIREHVIDAARRALALRVGRATVFALAKRKNEDWSEIAMATAFSKESLSIAADNYDENLVSVKRYVRDMIKLERLAA